MNIFPRPNSKILSAAALAGSLALLPHVFAAPACPAPAASPQQHFDVFTDDPALLNHVVPGYLGVGTRDVDSQRAAQLRLKEARGVEITSLDHDAPACKAGLKVHDVILAMDNQPVQGQAQLIQMLHSASPGRVVTLLISREGQQQSFTVQLVDRRSLDTQLQPVPPPEDPGPALPSVSYANNGGSGRSGDGFISSGKMNALYTGLNLELLSPQLASYFGDDDGQGLLVMEVDDNSPAADAGLRAGDVITRLNGQIVASPGQWSKLIRSNKGKQVQLTVIRDHKESSFSLMAGRPKTSGRLEWPDAAPRASMISWALSFAPAER